MPPPNEYQTVLQCHAETGDLINRDSTAFTDYVTRVLHAKNVNWGRKVRRAGEWDSRNSDAIAFLMEGGDIGRKHIVDVVSNSSDPGGPPSPSAAPAWQVHEGPQEGNGYWMVEPGTPDPPDPPPDNGDEWDALVDRVEALEADVQRLGENVTALAGVVGAQERELAELRARDDILESNLLRLNDAVAQLHGRVSALEGRLSVGTTTGRTWGHAHTVKL